MITGANTNVRYRGIVFHVQTEDSGRANPHIISHVYHGGTILSSEKTEYKDHLESDDLVEIVKGLIESQHARMLERLQGGGFDDVISQRLGDTNVDAGRPSRPDTKPDTRPEEPGVPTPPPRETPAEGAVSPLRVRRGERTFGEGIVSQKPLDEVILEYLAEKARDRATDRADKSARKSRSSG